MTAPRCTCAGGEYVNPAHATVTGDVTGIDHERKPWEPCYRFFATAKAHDRDVEQYGRCGRCYAQLSAYLTSKGWTLVEATCPECNYGQLVRDDGRYGAHVTCTAYGQCEKAPG